MKKSEIAAISLLVILGLTISYLIIAYPPQTMGGEYEYYAMRGDNHERIDSGTLVIVGPTEEAEIEDIVLFTFMGDTKFPIIENMVEGEFRNTYIVSEAPMEEIFEDEIEKKVKARIPFLGNIIIYSNEIVAIILLLLIGGLIYNSYSKEKQNKTNSK